MVIATLFVYIFYIYLAIGIIFAVWFVSKGAARLDEAMQRASWGMRLLLLPGSVALWPNLLLKIIRHKS